MNVIEFKSLPRDRQQAFADHIYKEIYRHKDDIERAYRELDYIALNFGIIPDRIYIGQWIEVIPNDENTAQD
jgi:hypothetical protein